MATGKNKLLLYSRLILDGYDLSGDSRTFGNLDNTMEQVQMSGWDTQIRKYLADYVRTVGLRGYQAFLNDTASSGAFTLLKDPAAGHELSFLIGGGAAPTYGDIAYLLAGVQIQDQGGFNEKAAILNADFLPESGITQDNPFGYVLFNHSLAATTQGTSYNYGAAGGTNAGWQANLHVLATSSGNFSFKVQHSTNDSVWVDLATFTLNGSAINSEHLSGTDTVNQYVRGLATRTGGTVQIVMTFARN